MMVRAEALAAALKMLPDPDKPGPETIALNVPEFRLSLMQPFDGEKIATQRLIIFRKEHFGQGSRRWREWMIDIAATSSQPP